MCHETLPLFASLHLRRHTTPPHEWWRAVLDFSRSVGVVLGRSDEVPTLQGVSAPAPSQPADDRAALHRAVWELLDTCFVDQAVADGSTADALAAWLRRNHGAVLSDVPTPGSLAAVLSRVVPACSSAARPEEVEEYWPAMGLLAACGWTRCAQELLHQHSAWADWRLRTPAAKPLVAVLEALERLLMHAPHGEALGAHSHAQAWRSAVLSTLASPSLWADVEGSATERGARQVVAIMAGDQEAVMAACEQATWVELFVALLCRVHSSCCTPRDLVRLAAACMGRKHVLNRGPTVLDELLVAALARDAPEVVRLCASGLDAWMSAHVVEVLSASPDAYELVHTPVASASQGTVTLSAWYRMQYAAACAANPALLHVACEYYAAAGPQGTKALHALLCAVSEEGDPDRQLRAYGLARQFGSGATASHVCAAAGSTAEAAGALGEAIHWYIRGDLPAKLAALVDSILPPQPWGAPDMTVVTSCLDSALLAPCAVHRASPLTPTHHRHWTGGRPPSRPCRVRDTPGSPACGLGCRTTGTRRAGPPPRGCCASSPARAAHSQRHPTRALECGPVRSTASPGEPLRRGHRRRHGPHDRPPAGAGAAPVGAAAERGAHPPGGAGPAGGSEAGAGTQPGSGVHTRKHGNVMEHCL